MMFGTEGRPEEGIHRNTKPSMATVVYLIRHAAYENPRKVYHGWLPGFHLSREGKLQAQRLALKLKNKPLVAVYSSHLSRAKETAEIIAKPQHLKVTIDDRIIDIKSPLQGEPITYLESVNWNQYRPEFIKAGGERLSEVYKRMDRFLKEKLKVHHGEQFAVVSHGDPIMVLKVKYLGDRLSFSSVRKRYDYIYMAGCLRLEFANNGKFLDIETLDNSRQI